MKKNHEIFEYHLAKIESILSIAQLDENPAQTLFQKDGRTPLFMLEGLCRLYSNLHNKNKFEKIKNHFKMLEDALGSIDYYDVYMKSYKNNPNVPDTLKQYMEQQRDLKFGALNVILKQNGWIGYSSNRLKKIRTSLKEVEWMTPKKEVIELQKIYLKTIDSVSKFIKKYAIPFTEMELQVHEVRRDLRWLSIYPHALQGRIQFAKAKGSENSTNTYLTAEILNSKYNQFPDQSDEKWVLLLEKNYFYALSWLIAEIGKLKDEGLEYYALLEAFKKTENLSEPEAQKKALKLLNWNESNLSTLLSKASEITNEFVKNGFLNQLVFGISQIKKHKP